MEDIPFFVQKSWLSNKSIIHSQGAKRNNDTY